MENLNNYRETKQNHTYKLVFTFFFQWYKHRQWGFKARYCCVLFFEEVFSRSCAQFWMLVVNIIPCEVQPLDFFFFCDLAKLVNKTYSFKDLDL